MKLSTLLKKNVMNKNRLLFLVLKNTLRSIMPSALCVA